MTNRQILDILTSLNVVHVFKDGRGRGLNLIVSMNGLRETTSLAAFKSRFTTTLHNLEERKQEVRENKFASRLSGSLGMHREAKLNVEFLKRDDQLTTSEREEKRRLLSSIEREIKHHRNVLSAVAVLQVRFKELREGIDDMERRAGEADAKAHARAVWTRGVAAAAAFCNNEWKKAQHKGKPPVEICRDFLAKYAIQGEEAYTAEQLLNNVLQVRAMNDAAE